MCQKSIQERSQDQEIERNKVEALERITARLEQLNGTIAELPIDKIMRRLDQITHHLKMVPSKIAEQTKALEPLQNLAYVENVTERVAGELVNIAAVIQGKKG